MGEKLSRFRGIAFATTLGVGAIGLVGCGSDTKTGQPPDTTPVNNGVGGSEFEITQAFNDRGQMITSYKGGNDWDTYSNVLSYCSGQDLLEKGEDSGYGTSPTRNPNHPACADGRLTPEDFAQSTQEEPGNN